MQRDQSFESYQDLEAAYHLRPGYWVEPTGPMGRGSRRIGRAADQQRNAGQHRSPHGGRASPMSRGQEIAFGYRLRAVAGGRRPAPRRQGREHVLGPGARQRLARSRRSDDSGGFSSTSRAASFPSTSRSGAGAGVPSTSVGALTQFVIPNEHIRGFRAAFDVSSIPCNRRSAAFLRTGPAPSPRPGPPWAGRRDPQAGSRSAPPKPADVARSLRSRRCFPTDRLERAGSATRSARRHRSPVAGTAAGPPSAIAAVHRRQGSALAHLASHRAVPARTRPARGSAGVCWRGAEAAARRKLHAPAARVRADNAARSGSTSRRTACVRTDEVELAKTVRRRGDTRGTESCGPVTRTGSLRSPSRRSPRTST
jgi:hypothetical protein